MTKQIPLTIFLTTVTIAVSIGQSITLVKDITPGTLPIWRKRLACAIDSLVGTEKAK